MASKAIRILWCAALLLGGEARAYVPRLSVATGNLTTAGTWAVVDNTSSTGTSYLDSENGPTAVGTSYTSNCTAAFQWASGAPTVDAVAVKVGNREVTPSTHTMSVCLSTSSSGASCVKEVTLNVSDLDSLQSLNQGFVVFKFASSSALSTATNYYVCAKTSSSSAVSLYRSSTTADWSHLLRTTTTGAPAAGDPLYVAGDWTAGSPDTLTSYTVTVSTNDTNDYGQVAASLCTANGVPTACCTASSTGATCPGEAVQVSKGGTLKYSSSASQTLNLQYKGVLAVFSSGEFDIGKCSARDYSGGCSTFIPSTSSATLIMNSTANVDSGLDFYSGSVGNIFGDNSPLVVKTLLGKDAANGDTTITTSAATGWTGTTGALATATAVVISSTSQTTGDSETKTLTGTCVTNGGTGCTSSGSPMACCTGSGTGTCNQCAIAALGTANTTVMCNTTGSYNHCGVAPTQADVGLITHNVLIKGASTSLQGYVRVQAGAQVVIRYAEFTLHGSATSNKRGIDVQATSCTTAPCFDLQYSSLHDFTVSPSLAINLTGAAATMTVSNNVFWNNVSASVTTAATTATWTLDSNLIVGTLGSNSATVNLGDVGGVVTNNIAASAGTSGAGFQLNEGGALVGTFSGNIAHSNGGAGVSATGCGQGSTLASTTVWRNSATAGGINFNNPSSQQALGIWLNGVTAFGNGGASILVTGGGNLRISGLVSNGDAKFPTTSGISFSAGGFSPDVIIEGASFDVAAGSGNNARVAHTNDFIVNSSNYATSVCANCTLSAATLISAQSTMAPGTYVGFQRFNTTAGDHRLYVRTGTIQTDTTHYDTASPGQKITPNSTTVIDSSGNQPLRAGSCRGFCAPVDTATKPTVTARVCLITTYNGAAPALVRLRNVAVYGTADVDETLATGTTSTGDCLPGGTGWQTLTGTPANNTTDAGVDEMVVQCGGGSYSAGYCVVGGWSRSD